MRKTNQCISDWDVHPPNVRPVWAKQHHLRNTPRNSLEHELNLHKSLPQLLLQVPQPLSQQTAGWYGVVCSTLKPQLSIDLVRMLWISMDPHWIPAEMPSIWPRFLWVKVFLQSDESAWHVALIAVASGSVFDIFGWAPLIFYVLRHHSETVTTWKSHHKRGLGHIWASIAVAKPLMTVVCP